jgi:hypothetical protein
MKEGPHAGFPSRLSSAVKMRVELHHVPLRPTLPGILMIVCIIGPQAPASHALEGEVATLDISGVINFNHTDHGTTSTSGSELQA